MQRRRRNLSLGRLLLGISSIAIILLVLCSYYWLIHHLASEASKLAHHHHSHPSGAWSFNAVQDASNYALTHEQCDVAFPLLYKEIDRAVHFWQDLNHTIMAENIDISWRPDGAFRSLIHDNELRILQVKGLSEHAYGNYSHRALAVMKQIHRALEGATQNGEVMPTIEFSVTVDDYNSLPTGEDDLHTIWHFARQMYNTTQDRIWAVPDFNFWSAPAGGGVITYDEARYLAKQRDSKLQAKKRQAVWRGAVWTNEAVRGSLLNVTKNKSWADVEEISWKSGLNMLRTEQVCDYMFLVHTEGQSWSGRLKYLFNCNCLPVVHKLDWTTHYYHLLVPEGPGQNYVPVSRNFSDLEDQVSWFLQHPVDAQRIVDNAIETFRDKYTTPAAEACYWRQLFRSWSMVAYTPDPYDDLTRHHGLNAKKILRGVPFHKIL